MFSSTLWAKMNKSFLMLLTYLSVLFICGRILSALSYDSLPTASEQSDQQYYSEKMHAEKPTK